MSTLIAAALLASEYGWQLAHAPTHTPHHTTPHIQTHIHKLKQLGLSYLNCSKSEGLSKQKKERMVLIGLSDNFVFHFSLPASPGTIVH